MAENRRKAWGGETAGGGGGADAKARACRACGCSHLLRRMQTVRTVALVCRNCGRTVAIVRASDV